LVITGTGPIGVFDSGVGGLSVVREIHRLLPNEDILYYADRANCPYGTKPPDVIRKLSIDATGLLLANGAKLIVVACNTASSAALATLRAMFSVPFVGMVPAVKPAAQLTHTRKVGVLATEATVHAAVFADLIAQFASGVSVYSEVCTGLVERVEEGDTASPTLRELLRSCLAPLLAQEVDTIVLGCTHYFFLKQTIQEIVGPNVTVLDTALPVAQQVQRVLEKNHLQRTNGSNGKVSLFASGDHDEFMEVVDHVLPRRGLEWQEKTLDAIVKDSEAAAR
jgi:glutamate racemase